MTASSSSPPAFEKASLYIVKTASHPDDSLECDSGKIHQVIRNLLSNAIKNSPRSGRMEFEYQNGEIYRDDQAMDAIELRVTDDGEGIDASDLEKIFGKFHQSRKTNQGGTGLGLSISREIVNLHKGQIWAENRPGRVAMFVVRLPRKKAENTD